MESVKEVIVVRVPAAMSEPYSSPTPPVSATLAEPEAQSPTLTPTQSGHGGQPPTSTAPAAPTTPPTLAEPGAQTLTPTPTAPEHTAMSVSGTRPVLSQTAAIIANLQKQDVAAVEAALVSVREANRRGDHSAIEEALIGQAVMLQSVGEALLRLAGCDPAHLKRVEAYTALALRSFEQARKALSTLGTMRGGPKNQTNVQVNVGAPGLTNEILEVPHE